MSERFWSRLWDALKPFVPMDREFLGGLAFLAFIVVGVLATSYVYR